MNYKFKTKPYAHQLTALEKSWNKESYAYFMEMGTGKTKVLISPFVSSPLLKTKVYFTLVDVVPHNTVGLFT